MRSLYFDVLDECDCNELRRIALDECLFFTCPTVPGHQSFSNMHLKHEASKGMRNLVHSIETEYLAHTGRKVSIYTLWFNMVTASSNFQWHKHDKPTAIFYLTNTCDNGTYLEFDNIPAQDNSLVFLEPHVIHKTPDYDGRIRLSIAADLNIVN